MFHYIFLNQFVSSDIELNPNEYPIGLDLNDYANGKYVPLNEQLIEYERAHLSASPEEVWEMHPVGYTISVRTPEDSVREYFADHNRVYINNLLFECYDHLNLVYRAQCAKVCGAETITFFMEGKTFQTTPDNLINIMYQVGYYHHLMELTILRHLDYLAEHPEMMDTYDYTAGYPSMLHFNLLEV